MNLAAHHYRISLFLGHLCQGEPELLGKMRAADLDEAQIRNVGDDASAICVEKHYPHFCADARCGHRRISDFKFEISNSAASASLTHSGCSGSNFTSTSTL